MTFNEKYLRAGRHRHRRRSPGQALSHQYRARDRGGIQKAAAEFLPRLLPSPDDETPPASFVIVHRGAGSAAYLNAYSWVWGT